MSVKENPNGAKGNVDIKTVGSSAELEQPPKLPAGCRVIQREIQPNALQKSTTCKAVLPVLIEALAEEVSPATITRLSAAKLRFLVEGIAQVRPGSDVLELFSGSGLGTARLTERVSANRITAVDLHYALNPERGVFWRYVPEENFRRACRSEGIAVREMPRFMAADAAQLPFAGNSFDFVIAPDSPRSRRAAGAESGLDPGQQAALFQNTAYEVMRVLRYGGVFAATAPLTWAHRLAELPFSALKLFSHADLPGTIKHPALGKNFKFKVDQVNEPIVYVRAIK